MRIKLSPNTPLELYRCKIFYTNKSLYLTLYGYTELDILDDFTNLIYNHGDKHVVINKLINHMPIELKHFSIVKTESSIIIKVKLSYNNLYLKFQTIDADNNNILIDVLD